MFYAEFCYVINFGFPLSVQKDYSFSKNAASVLAVTSPSNH